MYGCVVEGKKSSNLLLDVLVDNYHYFEMVAEKCIRANGNGETALGNDLLHDLYGNFSSHADDNEAPMDEVDAKRIILSSIKKYAKNVKYRTGDRNWSPLFDEEGNPIDVADERSVTDFDNVTDTSIEKAVEFFSDTFEEDAEEVDSMIDRLTKLADMIDSIESDDTLDAKTKAQKVGNILEGVRASGFKTEHSDNFKECFRVLFANARRVAVI